MPVYMHAWALPVCLLIREASRESDPLELELMAVVELEITPR